MKTVHWGPLLFTYRRRSSLVVSFKATTTAARPASATIPASTAAPVVPYIAITLLAPPVGAPASTSATSPETTCMVAPVMSCIERVSKNHAHHDITVVKQIKIVT